MKLEQTRSKQDIRSKILAQCEIELKHDRRNAHIVTLPAELWTFETELFGILNSEFSDLEFTLHCYEKDYDIYRKVSNGNLPFKVENNGTYFVSGWRGNVQVIYQRGNFDASDLDFRKHKKMIVWADYCKTPCNNRKHGYMIDDLREWMNSNPNSLFYQTHATNIRNAYPSTFHPAMINRGLRMGDWEATSRAFVDYFNDKRTMQIERNNIFDYEYLGGWYGVTHMTTAGWRTGKSNHLELIKVQACI